MEYKIKHVGIKHIDWVGLILSTELPSQCKAIAMYLGRMMNRDQDVAWPSLSRISYELSLGRSTVCRSLKILEDDCWITREKGSSKVNTRYFISFPKVVEEIIDSATRRPGSARAGLGSATQGLGVVPERDTNSKLNSKDNRGRFTPPSIQDVKEYCLSRKNGIDPEQFVNFYQSKGWKVGNAKMKDWKAAIITWEKRTKNEQHKDTYGAGAI